MITSTAQPTRLGMGGHHSAAALKDEWLTPPTLLKKLGWFDLDPCAPEVGARPWPTAFSHYSENGLSRPWVGRVWCNPPYGRATGAWLAKCAQHGNAIALIFARTETEDWHKHVWPRAHSILFLRGRIIFCHVDGSPAAHNSGAPSALIAYDAPNTAALSDSGIPGRLIEL